MATECTMRARRSLDDRPVHFARSLGVTVTRSWSYSLAQWRPGHQQAWDAPDEPTW